LSKNAGDFEIVVNIAKRGENMIHIVNISNWRAKEIGETLARRCNWQKIIRQGGCGTVLAGYLNAHTQHWDLLCAGQ